MLLKKKIRLFIFLIYYTFSVYIFAPLMIEYLGLSDSVAAEFLALLLSMGVPVFVLMLRNKDTDRQKNNETQGAEIQPILWSILASIIYFFAVQYLINAITLVYIIRTDDYSCVSLLPEVTSDLMLILLLVVALFPAFFEELYYRVGFFEAYADNKRVIAYIVSSVVFASSHSDCIQMLNAFLLGLMLFYIFERIRSVKLIVVLHFVYNLLAALFSYVTPLPFSPLDVLSDYASRQQITAAVAFSLGVFILMLVLLMITINGIARKTKNIGRKGVQETWSERFVTALILLVAMVKIMMKCRI